MPRLVWDAPGEHFYETGVDQGVLYVYDETSQADNKYGTGVVWNGLTTVSENPSGAEPTALWADNIKYLNLVSAEDFSCTIEAYTYPDEFMACDGSQAIATGIYAHQQKRKTFGFCYRTRIGNDAVGDSLGYKLHIVYGCTASPSERSYATVNDSPEAITFSWEVNTTPVPLGTINDVEYRPTAYIEIDSTKVAEGKWTILENKLYGTDGTGGSEGTAPTLPLPSEILTLIQ